MYTSDSLETILSSLSVRVIEVISDGNSLQHLYYLLEFLAAWKERPLSTWMAYQWCSAISEAAVKLGGREIPIIEPRPPLDELPASAPPIYPHQPPPLLPRFALQFRLGQQGLVFGAGSDHIPVFVEDEFSKVGPGCDPVHSGDTSYRTPGGSLEGPTPIQYAHLLSITLEIGFRQTPYRSLALFLDHTPHHDWMFETAFSSRDDEVIADALYACTVNRYKIPSGSFARYFSKCVWRDTPFSPRLRRASIYAIQHMWPVGPKMLVFEALDRLKVGMDDVEGHEEPWGSLLVDVVCFSTGLESVSSYYWDLLDKLAPFLALSINFGPRGMEVMRLLEEAEDLEKLETWVVVAWGAESLELVTDDVRRVTLNLLLQRPSTLPRFEGLPKMPIPEIPRAREIREELRRICNQARVEQSHLEPPPPYVSVRPARHLFVNI